VNQFEQLLVFSLDDRRYALRLEAVERVVRAVEVTPLPDAPEIVLGIINVQGRIVPVINLRKRFQLRDREVRPSDQFIITSTFMRTYALATDAVHGVLECPGGAVVRATEILPPMESVEGVLILADGMVLISDMDTVLSLEGEALDDRFPDLADLGMTTDEEIWEQGDEL
jgi:purine-binding chemotaxis protein CheW